MSSWGNNDNAANTPLWAAMSVKRAPDSTNQTALFDNTTQDTFITGRADGVFGISADEAAAKHGNLHTGWVLRTEGSGGRAGRVQEEVLVAMNTINSDSDGQTYANVVITLSGPSNGIVTSGSANANSVTFSVSPTLTGNTAATLTYQWQVNNNTGGSWVNMSNGNNPQPGGVQKSGVTTNTLTVTPWNTTANNYVFRCVVTAADEGVTATSANGQITIM